MTDEYGIDAASGPADVELVAGARLRDPMAFEALYRRHIDAVQRLARSLAADRHEADDLVAEAFARLLAALTDGGGPREAVRPYLLATVRHLFYDNSRRGRRTEVVDDLSRHDRGIAFADPAVADLERSLIGRAFAQLPQRWQLVLWHTEVEGESPATVAPLLGLTPNAVAALAYRAREGLRQQYLQEHIARQPSDACRFALDRLGAHTRDGLSKRDSARVTAHLADCQDCHLLFIELADVNSRLGVLLAPVLLAGGAGAYLSVTGMATATTSATSATATSATATSGGAATIAPAGGTTPGASSSGGPAGAGRWRRLVRRRSRQVLAAVAVIVAVLIALSLLLTGRPVPTPEAATKPEHTPRGTLTAVPTPAPTESTVDLPTPPDPVPGRPRGSAAPTVPVVPPGVSALDAQLEPVGALIRGRPGVLALTVVNSGPAGPFAPARPGTLGRSVPQPVAPRPAVPQPVAPQPAVPRAAAPWPAAVALPGVVPALDPVADTGPLTALLVVPAGVSLRAGPPGDGWTCATDVDGIRCVRPALAAHSTSRAYVPVTVSPTASAGTPSVRLSAPHGSAANADATGGVQNTGLAAVVAATMPAAVAVGGNALLSCPLLALTCPAARAGQGSLLGGTDNGDYIMSRYADPAAPPGAPEGSAVSGATIAVAGPVAWAGLYWAGSGAAPPTATAYLLAPGSTDYVPVRAGRIDAVSPVDIGQPAYQASADVTALLRTGKTAGTYWLAVAGGSFDEGFNSFGGWALMVIYDDGGPARTVAIFDGCTPLRGTQAFSSNVYGTADGPARVAFVGWEGDRGITGDQLHLGPTALGGEDANNIATSRADGTPAGWNTFGVDARIVDGRLPSTRSEQVITASTSGDAWLLGAVAVIT